MDTIYESDIDHDYARLLNDLDLDDELAADRAAYAREVADCCGGRIRDCIHFRHGGY